MMADASADSFWHRLFTTSQGVARLSITAVSILIVIKVVASVLTGSLGIRADAIHSVIDLTGAIIGLVGIMVASHPADSRHHYGHGKAENLAGAIISVLIFAAAGSIVYTAVMRIISGGRVEMLATGIVVTVVAIAINIGIAMLALRVARKTESVALRAQGFHMMADVWSSVAVLIGLVLVTLTGLVILDAVVGILVALIIGKTAWEIMKDAVGVLMDTRLPDDEEQAIRDVINQHGDTVTCIRSLRTRRSGAERFVDLVLVMPPDTTVMDTHRLCDHLEHHFRHYLSSANISIHVEPRQPECEECSVSLTLSVTGSQSQADCPYAGPEGEHIAPGDYPAHQGQASP